MRQSFSRSEHGYGNEAELVEKIDFAIAGEVVKGPYQIAHNHVAEQNLQEKIEVRLANGLAA
ncbi:tRNA (adenine(22)-N(1))-methyltransferase TrmK, partial [Lactococcus petauri]|uniref:tRNA (adenine(22)-N(1))-methyltransferase TrmK n=1 Tax=Lactococcus petauri TaxID=1940789 RepID=UPI0023ED5DE4